MVNIYGKTVDGWKLLPVVGATYSLGANSLQNISITLPAQYTEEISAVKIADWRACAIITDDVDDSTRTVQGGSLERELISAEYDPSDFTPEPTTSAAVMSRLATASRVRIVGAKALPLNAKALAPGTAIDIASQVASVIEAKNLYHYATPEEDVLQIGSVFVGERERDTVSYTITKQEPRFDSCLCTKAAFIESDTTTILAQLEPSLPQEYSAENPPAMVEITDPVIPPTWAEQLENGWEVNILDPNDSEVRGSANFAINYKSEELTNLHYLKDLGNALGYYTIDISARKRRGGYVPIFDAGFYTPDCLCDGFAYANTVGITSNDQPEPTTTEIFFPAAEFQDIIIPGYAEDWLESYYQDPEGTSTAMAHEAAQGMQKSVARSFSVRSSYSSPVNFCPTRIIWRFSRPNIVGIKIFMELNGLQNYEITEWEGEGSALCVAYPLKAPPEFPSLTFPYLRWRYDSQKVSVELRSGGAGTIEGGTLLKIKTNSPPELNPYFSPQDYASDNVNYNTIGAFRVEGDANPWPGQNYPTAIKCAWQSLPQFQGGYSLDSLTLQNQQHFSSVIAQGLYGSSIFDLSTSNNVANLASVRSSTPVQVRALVPQEDSYEWGEALARPYSLTSALWRERGTDAEAKALLRLANEEAGDHVATVKVPLGAFASLDDIFNYSWRGHSPNAVRIDFVKSEVTYNIYVGG